MAGELEDQPGLWSGRFRRLLASGLIMGLETDSQDLLWDTGAFGQFGLRFQLMPGDETRYTRSIQQLAARISGAVAAGRPVAVDLSDAPGAGPSHQSSEDRFAGFLAALELRLPISLRRLGLSVRGLHLSLLASHPGQRSFLGLRFSSRLGRPRLLLRVPEHMTPGKGGSAADWQRLTAMGHGHPGLELLPAQITRPLSEWCRSESSNAVLPVLRVAAPADTAWLTFGLDAGVLARAARAHGNGQARRLLGWCLRFADNLMDVCEWPGAGLRVDSQRNRRICFQLLGLGALVQSRGLDPRRHRTRAMVQGWLQVVCRTLRQESQHLARIRGPFPALGIEELSRSVQSRYGDEMAQLASRRFAFRHRQILAISPFDFIPSRSGPFRPADYLHLVPLTAFADVLSLYGSERRRLLSLGQYRRLLQLSWAASQGPANSAHVIAAPVESVL